METDAASTHPLSSNGKAPKIVHLIESPQHAVFLRGVERSIMETMTDARPSYAETMAAIDAVISAVHSDSEREDALYDHMREVVARLAGVTPGSDTD